MKTYCHRCKEWKNYDVPPRHCPQCRGKNLGVEDDATLHALCKLFLKAREWWSYRQSERSLVEFFDLHPQHLQAWNQEREKLTNPNALKLPADLLSPDGAGAYFYAQTVGQWTSDPMMEILRSYPGLMDLRRDYVAYLEERNLIRHR